MVDVIKETVKTDVFWCSTCLNMSTRPRITFDEEGRCNACQWVDEKKILNWNKRESELLELLDRYRSKNNGFDCVVPVSGGKDGSYVAHTLRDKYGMNPLAISVKPPLSLELGDSNLERFMESGYNLIHLKLHPGVMRFIDKMGFIEKGFPYFGWLIAIQSAVLNMAASLNIGLVFYGEDGEVEYGGSTETKNISLIDIQYQKRVWFESGYDKIIGMLPKNLEKAAAFWRFPDDAQIKRTRLHTATWSYFENWDSYRNYLIAKKHCGLEESGQSNEGTFTNFSQNDQALYALHTYMMYLKFGFGRATQDAGIEIRRGAMSRDQAVNLVRLYDGQYPKQHLDLYLDYYEMTKHEFDAIVDKWANKKLFTKKQGFWEPNFTVK